MRAALSSLALCIIVALSACTSDEAKPSGRATPKQKRREVVVYTALDRQFSEPILKEFETRTGIEIRPVFDTEAVKTVGLVNRIIAERARPQCDVFWNNEVLRSIQLQREGVVEPYISPSASDIPAKFKDPEGYWTGFAARARVFIAALDLKGHPVPSRIEDIISKDSDVRVACFAKPLFGTTSTHAAVMWAMAGEEKALAFWREAKDKSVMLSGNAQTRDAVVAGEMLFGLTDTDDAMGALEDGAPVQMIYPSGGPEGEGFLLIPNSVVLIKDAPNQGEARELIDYLLSREVEAALAQSRSAQIPVREGIPGPTNLPPPPLDLALEVDWEKVADALPESQKKLAELFGS